MQFRFLLAKLARQRRHVSEILNLLLATLALPAAFLVRFEFPLDADHQRMLPRAVVLALGIKFAVFRVYSIRDLAWRYLGFDDLLRICVANLTASMALAGLLRLEFGGALPRSMYLLDLLLSLSLLTGARAAARLMVGHRPTRGRWAKSDAQKRLGILIYGAGQAGRRILEEIRENQTLGVEVKGFIDDDPAKRNLRIGGVRVQGTGEQLAEAALHLSIQEIWLALPVASTTQVAAILDHCRQAQLPVKRIPPLAELLQSRILLDQLREIQIEDLLGRAPVRSDESPVDIRALIAGKVILVTGAGGSIGSELCRQIARLHPRALVGLDCAETALYQIDQQMREQFPHVPFYPEVGNIQNRRRLNDLFACYRPAAVYHAAAYKHVPLMESHVFEAIENNVFGTCTLARVARNYGVQNFVLISSDKAVRPTNVMGATKRLSEQMCLGRATDQRITPISPFPRSRRAAGKRPTRFLAVRFGNVLGSSGSVVPLFRRQIAAGGPVTVTHPEMQRYFMTIPEAAELVLQATSLGSMEVSEAEISGGDIFVLDMGEPVKILDLAKKMISLSGLCPGRDIQIEFSGVRPGEKLFEELQGETEDTLPTRHPKIRVYRARNPADKHSVALSLLKPLRQSVARRDLADTIAQLKELIPEYSPSMQLLSQALGPEAEMRRPKAVGASMSISA